MTETLLDSKTDDQIQIDPNKDYWKELTGEGGKFHRPNEEEAKQLIARGKVESDAYIKHMEGRMDEMRTDFLKIRDENTSKAKLEELIDQLAKQQTLTSSDNTLNVNEEKVNKPTIDPKEIESLVSSEIQKHELTKKQRENFDKVRIKLKERYGDNFSIVLKEQIERLGMTPEYADNFARQYPDAFFKTFELDTTSSREDFQSPLQSSRRSDSFSPSVPKRTWAYYQKMKKDKPDLYRNPKTVVQMHHDAEALGDAFKDGDYNSYN